MFNGIEGIKFGYVLCGIIWSIALGFAVGNYACSLVHRLPRGRLLLDKKPYCGTCGTMLQVKDLFPVVSALLLRHRCRYCKAPFPVSHTWTELLVGLLFVLAFLAFSFSDEYILVSCTGVFLITLAAIEANERQIMGKVLLATAICGMLYRTLEDGTIYHFFQGGLLSLVIGAVIWRKQIKPAGHIYKLPKQVELLTVGGICIGFNSLPVFYGLFAVLYGVDWIIRKAFGAKSPPLLTVSFGFAVILPMLYPELGVRYGWSAMGPVIPQ